ncbi:MAG: response regulator [Deltaproteobacteria bacterium]|nr:response regulator [Deltaproteobacteria bacterium]
MWNIFHSFKISKRVAAVFLILLAMMSIGGVVGLYNGRQIANVTKELYGNFFTRQDTLSSIEKELLTERQGVFLYITITDAASKSYLKQSLKEHDNKIKNLIEEYLRVEQFEHGETAFEKAWSDYKVLRDKAIGIYDNGDIKKATVLLYGDLSTSFKSAMDILQLLLTQEKDSAFNQYERADYLSKVITWTTLVMTIVAIIVSVSLWSMLTRSIVKPIEILEGSARRIASGNLKERVAITSNDEIGALAAEFNSMVEHLEYYYATLEKKVEERTRIIKNANDELFRKKQEMEILNEELVKANKMKSQFLANISHELRTPLNSIMGFSDLLLEKAFGELNEKQVQYVNYIHTSGRHLLHLINNILDLSKIEAGRLELEAEEFHLSDVIDEVVGIIRPMAHKKGITIETETTFTSPIVKLDKPKFKQIMLNLLSNAVKFNRDGGQVSIGWNIAEELKEAGIERILQLSVKDTGIGIKDEDIPRIFMEFEQLDPSITREYGGTGLGLTLTKKLVELHSGRIWVESKYGKSTTFSFAIPQGRLGSESAPTDMKSATASILSGQLPDDYASHFLPNEIEKDMPAKYQHGHEAPFATILVASESKAVNELIKVYLTQNGYDVELADDGVEVIEKANQMKPFAIIIGITIPKKDGWEVLKELKSSPDTCDIPAIIISAANNKELGFSLGAVDYLVKPVNKDKLLDTLNRLSFTAKIKRHPFSILAIDDEPQVLEFLGDILEKEGFGVLKATNGEDGIALAIERDPDLIILDLMMPHVSGFDVVYQLKKHPTAKDIPIIIFTAKDITTDDKVKLGDDIADILKKAEFSKNGLLREIEKLEMAYPARAKMIDPLTRVFNHRYFNYWIIQEIARGKRYGIPFAMLMVDVDRLHDYNTANGFLLGNEVLVDLARLLEDNIRKADCLIRHGGDEFLIVLPSIRKEVAAAVAEKLRIRVEGHAFHSANGKKNARITVSIGVATFPADGKESNELIQNISHAVRSAFQSGGNKVTLFNKAT